MLPIVASVALRSASPLLCTTVPSYATWLLGCLASWLLGFSGFLASWLLGFFFLGYLASFCFMFLLGFYRPTRLRGYAATRLRGYASTLSDNPTVNYARVMLTSGGDVDVPVTLRRQRAPSTRDFDLVIATCRHIALDCRRRLSIWSALSSPLSVPYVAAPVGAPPLLYA